MSLRVSVGQPYEAPATRAAEAQRAFPTSRDRIPATGIIAVWRSALAVLVLRAPAILLLTCVCIAGPAMLCLLAQGTNLRLNWYAHASGPFATWQGVTMLQGSSINAGVVLLCLQAVLGALGLAFARGVIARLALNSSGAVDASSLSLACREAMTRLPSLLAGALLYGACITVGAVGINAALRDTALDLSLVGQRALTAPGHLRVLALRTLDAFVPNPGSPFVEFVPILRHSNLLGRLTSSNNGSEQWVHDQVYARFDLAPTPGADSASIRFAISLASLGVLLLAEALLRFTPIMTMNACGRTWLNAITPVLRSIGFGIRYFGSITVHMWLLRLAFVAGYSVFFMLPLVLSEDVAPPIVTNVARSVMGSWSITLTLVCHALITALFVAFSTVYDARLAMHLDPLDIAQTRSCSFSATHSWPRFPQG